MQGVPGGLKEGENRGQIYREENRRESKGTSKIRQSRDREVSLQGGQKVWSHKDALISTLTLDCVDVDLYQPNCQNKC